MTDKEKIKAEIERLKESGCASPIVICDTLLAFIDSMQEEPVSDDLEIAACQSFNSACEDLNKEDKDSATYVKEYFKELWMCAFKDGANWQKQKDKELILMLKDQIESCHTVIKCKDELLKYKLREQKDQLMKDLPKWKKYKGPPYGLLDFTPV